MSENFEEKAIRVLAAISLTSILPYLWAIAELWDSYDAYNKAMSFIKRGIYGYWYNVNGIGTLHRYYSYVDKADAAVSSMQIDASVAFICFVVIVGCGMAAAYLYFKKKYSNELAMEVAL